MKNTRQLREKRQERKEAARVVHLARQIKTQHQLDLILLDTANILQRRMVYDLIAPHIKCFKPVWAGELAEVNTYHKRD